MGPTPASGTSSQPVAHTIPSRRERRHPPVAAGEARDRRLREDDHDRVHEEEQPDLGLRHARLVLRVHGQDVEAGEPREDEERVQPDHRDERPVGEHLPVRARATGRTLRAVPQVRLRDEGKHHGHVHEERDGVEQEEQLERARRVGGRDQAARERAEPDAAADDDALHREGRRALLGGREAGDQGRLGRPEAADADPADGRDDEPLPRLVDEHVAAA